MPADPILGEICLWPGQRLIEGWAWCNGEILQISQYTALYSILGTTYGGDGRITFGLPDLRGRVPMGAGQGPGISGYYTMGQRGGVEWVTLVEEQMPAHNHGITLGETEVAIPATTAEADLDAPDNNAILAVGNFDLGMDHVKVKKYTRGNPTTTLRPFQVTGTPACDNTGKNQAHINLQPYNVVNYIIALDGVYPRWD